MPVVAAGMGVNAANCSGVKNREDEMKQFTREQAVALFEAKIWKEWSDKEIVDFQLYQDRLCMPFDRFHQAMESVFARTVWTHEFVERGALRAELTGDQPAPTFQEISELIPEEKRILVLTDQQKETGPATER